MSDRDLPEPGTPEAVAQGCTCQPNDGEAQESDRWPGWLTRGCPLHDQQ